MYYTQMKIIFLEEINNLHSSNCTIILNIFYTQNIPAVFRPAQIMYFILINDKSKINICENNEKALT